MHISAVDLRPCTRSSVLAPASRSSFAMVRSAEKHAMSSALHRSHDSSRDGLRRRSNPRHMACGGAVL